MLDKARDVAQYIVNYFIKKGAPINNLRLQKLLYFAWINYYKTKREPLFGESFIAWPLGPVLPEAYYEFCAYGSEPISRAREVSSVGFDAHVVNRGLEFFGKFDTDELIEMSHHVGGAWDQVYKKGLGRDNIISLESIEALECRH